MHEYRSEVARIRAQIEQECQAIRRVFEDPAIVASHQAIEARYRNVGQHQEALAGYLGEQEAKEVMVDMYQKIIG